MRNFHLHLVSDATGETCITIARAAAAQFQGVDAVEHLWSLVRTESQLRRVLAHVEGEPGVVMFTLVDPQLRALLLDECSRIDVPCIPLLDAAIAALSGFLGAESRNQPGRQHVMDAAYLKRIEAMNYALGHDDGRSPATLGDADIVLVGVSRTSKTPTSIYLANHWGIKAANVPIVPGIDLPDELFRLKRPFCVGLTAASERLVQVRRNRLLMLRQDSLGDYADIEAVKDEVTAARRLFGEQGWSTIDVTRRSIEETATAIYQLYRNWMADREPDGRAAPE
jgi:regulator of PEP synthase PpsR (kinase-PPPase family)